MCVCACAHASAGVSCVGGDVAAAAELRGAALADQPDPLQAAVVRHARAVPHEVRLERIGSRHGGRANYHRHGVLCAWYGTHTHTHFSVYLVIFPIQNSRFYFIPLCGWVLDPRSKGAMFFIYGSGCNINNTHLHQCTCSGKFFVK